MRDTGCICKFPVHDNHKIRRLGLLWGILWISLLALTACPSSTPTESRQLLRVALETAPQRFDPRFAVDVASQRVVQLVYNGLVRLNAQAQIVPDVAASWETPKPTVYVFHLRRDVTWHDGERLTAADVHHTFTSLLDEKNQSPKRASFDKIRSIEMIDEYTIRFELSEPFAPFLTNMTLGLIPKPKAGEAERDHDAHPIGTGPFKFDRVEPNVAVHLLAYDAYFDGRAKVDGVVLRILPDAMVRVFELQKGNVDLIQNALPPDLLTQLRSDKQFEVIQAPGTNFMYLGLNCQDDILKHVAVRQALAHAIDRQAMIRHVLSGLATLADGILPSGHWAYEANVPRYAYDPERAAQLLDQAGFPDPDGDGPQPRFQLTYKTSQNEEGRRIAEVLQEQLRQVSIAVDIRSFEWGTFFGDIRAGNFQLYALTWVGVTEPDIFHYVFHSQSVPPAGANRGRYLNAELDGLLDAGRRAPSPEARRTLYSQAQVLIATELPYVPLWHHTNVAVLRSTFRGYQLTPSGDFRVIRMVEPHNPDKAS
ncbi:peptide ABC transporter substrate-binding protein [Candidatus Entotheonella serta]|nr:peptide ABC transporter substrate-binding protein [Candidatus Entotheonella serta]